MSLKMLSARNVKTISRRVLEFDSKETPGWGYRFDLDDNDNPIFNSDAARKNYEFAHNNPDFAEYKATYDTKHVEPAKGQCSCGEVVALVDQYYGAFSCPKCGKWYNMFGQELLHPKYWDREVC